MIWTYMIGLLGITHPVDRLSVKYDHVLNRVLAKHSVDEHVNVYQFHRVMKDLGTDVSRKNTKTLFIKYGDGETLTIDEFHRVLKDSTTTSPSRYFWLPVDPHENGIRQTRPKWNRFALSGLLSPVRVAHFGIGTMSLVIGTFDYGNFVFSGGIPEISTHDATWHGFIHTMAAILSLPRFDYKVNKEKPFNLWMSTARDANMWPSFIVFLWYMCAMQSDFMNPYELSRFHIQDPVFQQFTVFTTIALLYGSSRTIIEKDQTISGVYISQISNVIYVMTTITIPIMGDTVKSLILVKPEVFDTYTDIITKYPEYTKSYLGITLVVMYLGNLACALASAEHHGAITRRAIGDLSNVLNLVALIAAFWGIFDVDKGNLASSMIDVTIQGVNSFMTA